MKKLQILFIVAIVAFIGNKAYGDCCDCGPIYKDGSFELPFCINNDGTIKLSKSLFNIPALLSKSNSFYIERTVKLENNLLETGGSYYISYFDDHLLFWHKKDSTCVPLWIIKKDWAWHEPVLIDLNKDKKLDLFIRAGHEDISETFIYLNKITSMEFSETNFVLAYHKGDEYVNIIDANQDKHPELIEVKGKTYAKEIYNGEVEQVQILTSGLFELADKSIIDNIKAEYTRIFNTYDNTKYNFDFNMPGYRYKFLLRPFGEIRIISFDDNNVKDITASFSDHITWRINMLIKLQPFATEEGKKKIEELIKNYTLLKK